MAEPRPAGGDELRLHLLVLRCQAGDDRAFAELHSRFAGPSLRYLKGLVDEDAEDVHQDLWLTIYRRIRGLSNPRAFRTWLFQATRHRAIDALRRRKRERDLLQDVSLEAMADDAPEEPEQHPALDDPGLAGVIRELAPAQREVLLLRFQDDMSYAEIALVIGCSIGTVKSRLHHAKRRLSELKGELQ